MLDFGVLESAVAAHQSPTLVALAPHRSGLGLKRRTP